MTDDLKVWLDSTVEVRQSVLDYSKSPIDTDPGKRQLDVSAALERGQVAGDLLADIEVHLAQSYAAAMLEARKDYDAQTARAVAKGKVSDVQRLRDGIAVCYQTIKDRRFSLMNLNRS